MPRYAQIDAEGLCISVSDLSDPVDAPHMIALGPEEFPARKRWTGQEWEDLPSPPLTGDDVNAERDRRIAAGHLFTVEGYGDVPLQGRLQDQINLQARLIAAQGYKAAGVTAPALILRDAENVNHMLTPDQMIDLVGQGVAWIEATMMVSWAMKDGTAPFEQGVPSDYTDDAYWP